jgi:protein involved in polysaccharide export with SLBB domain
MSAGLVAAGLILALAQATGAEPDGYRVGPGDVLEVLVRDHPELSRLPTVQTTGAVFIPHVGDVPVSGLTPAQIAERIAPLLASASVPDPEVVVRVKEYQSQFVWVRGEVFRPGRKALREGTRLIDALLDAGGLTDRASGVVVVRRTNGTFPNGGSTLECHLAGGQPTPEETSVLSLPLASGDVIAVQTQHWVSVGGEVLRPGRLVDAAGGTTRFSSGKVTIRRGEAGAEIEADLGAIRSGKAEDVGLAPGDLVVISARGL